MKFPMLAISSVVIVLLSAAASHTNAQSADQTQSLQANTSDLAPQFTEQDINDKGTISLNTYRGKVVMLNFWATWCPPCKAEVPALEQLQETHKDALVIIGAAVFSSSVDIDQFYKDYKINYPIIMGSYELMDEYGKISAVPTTILINKKGEIVGTVVGSRTQEQYEEILKPLLAG